jgi:hypothetical protein
MAQHREVLGSIPCTDPTLILVEGHIQDPVHLVLNAPVTAHCLPKGSGRGDVRR